MRSHSTRIPLIRLNAQLVHLESSRGKSENVPTAWMLVGSIVSYVIVYDEVKLI